MVARSGHSYALAPPVGAPDQAEQAGRSPAENTFYSRVQEVRKELAQAAAEEERLFLLCSNHLYKEEFKAITSLLEKSEGQSKTSIKTATSTLKQARSYTQALLSQIQEKARDYPRQLQALQARTAQIKADLSHAETRIKLIGDTQDLAKEVASIAVLRKAVQDAEALLRSRPAEGLEMLSTPAKTASQLRATVDQIFTERAVQIDSAASGQEPPVSTSQIEKNLALLRLQLRAAEALAVEVKFKSSDQATVLKGIQERLAAIPAMMRTDPMNGIEEASEVKAEIQWLTEILEGYQQGLRRVEQRLESLTLESLPSRKPLWERFQAFCLAEFSSENIPMWLGIRERRFNTPKTKMAAYLEYLTPTSPSQANVSQAEVKECFPNSQLPTQEQMDDWTFWAQVDYNKLERPLATNLSDTCSRFKFALDEPLKAEISRSKTLDCPKIIAKWEARLG